MQQQPHSEVEVSEQVHLSVMLLILSLILQLDDNSCLVSTLQIKQILSTASCWLLCSNLVFTLVPKQTLPSLIFA